MFLPSLLEQRLRLAVATLPTATGWLMTIALLLLTSAAILALNRHDGFLVHPAPRPPHSLATRILLIAWLSPALIEELLFRVLLIPHPRENVPFGTWALWSLIALALFVGAHPIRTVLRPLPRNRVFTDRRFLRLATLLGIACTGAYTLTGSVWAPVTVHYLLVIGWLIAYGGWQQITHDGTAP